MRSSPQESISHYVRSSLGASVDCSQRKIKEGILYEEVKLNGGKIFFFIHCHPTSPRVCAPIKATVSFASKPNSKDCQKFRIRNVLDSVYDVKKEEGKNQF